MRYRLFFPHVYVCAGAGTRHRQARDCHHTDLQAPAYWRATRGTNSSSCQSKRQIFWHVPNTAQNSILHSWAMGVPLDAQRQAQNCHKPQARRGGDTLSNRHQRLNEALKKGFFFAKKICEPPKPPNFCKLCWCYRFVRRREQSAENVRLVCIFIFSQM
jgi:hypothetical protein